jgi:DnaK suppressor protein
MAKAKAKKPAPKAKPVVKKAASAKKANPPKKVVKAAPAKKAVAAKKPAAPAKKAPAMKVSAPQTKKVSAPAKPAPAPVKAKPAPVAAAPTAKSPKPAGATVAPIKGATAQPVKMTPVSKPVKPIPIPSEVLKLKDKPSAVESMEASEKREIHQSDIFSEEELRTFLEALKKERAVLLDKARAAVDGGNIALDKDEMYDEVDLASATVDQNLTFRLLDRDRKLLNEIDHAIQKIQTGDFGYCEGTGEPIPKRRLELRPWCRHSVKYKEQLEKLEKSGRGVVDEDAEMLD